MSAHPLTARHVAPLLSRAALARRPSFSSSACRPTSHARHPAAARPPACPRRLIFFIACNFFVYLLLTSLLIALITNVFMQHMKDPRSRWHLERARASLMIESSLTTWERLSLPLQHRYFIWLRPASWAAKGEVELPPRPFLFSQENDLTEVRRSAEKRKAGPLKSFVSPGTRKLLDIEEDEE